LRPARLHPATGVGQWASREPATDSRRPHPRPALHDNPVLSAAAESTDPVVPLFVLDDAILRSAFNRPNRAAFLVDCLRDRAAQS
jgi:DNA photolyase